MVARLHITNFESDKKLNLKGYRLLKWRVCMHTTGRESTAVLEPSTPSGKDGIAPETEARYKFEGVKCMKEITGALKLQTNTFASGSVYFYRFYSIHSFKRFDRWDMAAACIFVGGKVEEQPKKLKDIVVVFHQCRAQLRDNKSPDDETLSKEKYKILRDRILAMERVLLQSLRFDLLIEHPFKPLLNFASQLTTEGGDKLGRELVQKSWNYVSDSFLTSLCLVHKPKEIAAALLHLSARTMGVKLKLKDQEHKEGREWWIQFLPKMQKKDVENICHGVLDLYEAQPVAPADTGRTPDRRTSTSSGGSVAKKVKRASETS